jgi:hypothetical protein
MSWSTAVNNFEARELLRGIFLRDSWALRGNAPGKHEDQQASHPSHRNILSV